MKQLHISLVVILIASFFVALPTAPARATSPSSDATLQNIEGHGSDDPWAASFSWVRMATFSPTQDFYDVYSITPSFLIYARANDAGASVTISSADGQDLELAPANQGYFQGYVSGAVNLAETSNQMLTLRVTSQDGTATKVYTLKVSAGNGIATPQVISNSADLLATSGGTRGAIYLKNWTPCTLFKYTYSYKDASGVTQNQSENYSADYLNTDSNGISKVALVSPGTLRSFRDTSLSSNLVVSNDINESNCIYHPWWIPPFKISASTTVTDSIHFLKAEVTSTTIPDTVSQDTIFTVSGPGMSGHWSSLVEYKILDPATGDTLSVDKTEISNNKVQLRVSQYNSGDIWKTNHDMQFVVSDVASEGVDPWPGSIVLFRKNIKFTPEMATSVSLSPAKGPTQGGNKVTISGHGICNGMWGWATIRIGGRLVDNNYTGLTCDFNSSSNGLVLDGISTATFLAPPGPAGPADITVDMGYGPTTLSQKYIYGAAPTVSAIAPSTVANTGGAIVTLTGTNFGISGTPVVIIDGQKSPFVTRVSPTKVRAMIPASTSVGRVDVDILSSSGGGGLSQLASLTYAQRSSDPSVSGITPTSGNLSGGNTVVISGSGFSATASGVTFGGRAARITAATATSITVEAPAGSALGASSMNVATPTGLMTLSSAYNYLPDPGVTSVSPTSIRSTATGNDAKVTITGVGFGSSGTLTIGSASAVAYTASAGGTVISGISIPTSAAGRVSVAILPTGATKPFTTSVTVTSPKIDYFGPKVGGLFIDEGTTIVFGDNNPFVPGSYGWSVPLAAANNGGDLMKITGTGFGSSGQIKFGDTVIPYATYTDTEITFVSPSGFTPGTYDLRVIPATGTLFSLIRNAVTIARELSGGEITAVSAVTPSTSGDPLNYFWPNSTDSNLYTIAGNGFFGSDSGANTRVYMQGSSDFYAGNDTWQMLEVVSSTDSSIVVKIPRNLEMFKWNAVRVVTNRNILTLSNAVYYNGTQPPPISGGDPANPPSQSPGSTLNQSSFSGLCNNTPIGSRNPAVVTFTNDFQAFGAAGLVYLGTTLITSDAIDWASDGSSVSVNFASTDIQDVWGGQVIAVASWDHDPRFFNFACSATTTVTTAINGETSQLTVNAGTPLVPTSTLNDPLPNTSWLEPSSNYEYQTAASHAINGSYTRGLPPGAGDFYVRARIQGAAYDTAKYLSITPANSVHVVIVGQDLTLTPRLVNGSNTIVYKGQLSDGSNGSSNDVALTTSQAPNDPITSVTYEYRNHACTSSAWTIGLPKDVAVIPSWCGGDDSSLGSWDIRVKSFEMRASGVNKANFYIPHFEVFNFTITKAQLTLSAVTAQKTYNGLIAVTLGEITVTGAVDGENPTLDSSFAQSASFADPLAGVNKPVTLGGSFTLSSLFAKNYTLNVPNASVVGTINKADNMLRVEPDVTSVILGQTSTINLTVLVTDVLTGQTPIADARVSAPVLVSATPTICEVNFVSGGWQVTPLDAGDCVIEATQAASDNYNAGVSYHKSPSLTESIKIKIYPAAVTVGVIADDLKFAEGESVYPSASITGLLNADTFDGVNFDYYQGSTLLNSAPTAIGTYRVVPRDGSVSTASPLAYSSIVRYVAGTLIITAAPPTISSISPSHGPEAGGNTVVITGTGFGALTSISLGDRSLRKPNFTVNGDGTQVSFVVPPGRGGLDIELNAGEAEADATYAYDAPYIPPTALPDNGGTTAPPVVTAISPANGPETGGNTVIITGTGLAALTNIVLGSNTIDGAGFTVNGAGTQVTFVAPAGTGTQDLTLVAGLLETTTTYTYHVASAPTTSQAAGLVLSAITPAHGPEAGGNTVVITGTGFGALTGIMLGSKLIFEPSYTINGNGTQVSFVMPAGTGTLRISLLVGSLHTDAVYTYDTEVKGSGTSKSHLVLMLDLAVGAKLSGQKVAINGGGLAAGSSYTLTLHSKPVVIFQGVTDSTGAFDQKFLIQTKACLSPGMHTFVLAGKTPDGKEIKQDATFSLVGNCVVGGTVEKTSTKQLTLSGFLFDFRSSVLTKDAKKSLDNLTSFVKGAKSISIFGYTETDATSAAVKAANLQLAKARAVAVQAYLKSKGVVAKWITIGKGGTNPVSVVDQYKNRRVVIQANF